MNAKDQTALELNYIQRDADKYYGRQDKLRDKQLGDQTDAHSYIIRRGILDVADALEFNVNNKSRGVGGKYNQSVKRMAARIDAKTGEVSYDYAATAFIGIQAVFQSFDKKNGNTWNALAHTIAARLEADLKARMFEAHEPAYYHRVMQSFDEQMITQYQHKHRVIMMKFNEFDFKWKPWDSVEKIQVANKILIAIIDTLPDIFFRNSYRDKGKVVACIDLHPEADVWLAEFERERGFLRPTHPPLLVEPIPWQLDDDGNISGGYYTARLSATLPFVKSHSQKHREFLKLKSRPMVEHIDAVNKMQRTKWRINTDVLNVQTFMLKNQLGVGLPRYEPKALPDFPEHIANIPAELWTEQQQDEVTTWKGISKRIHTQNRIQKGKFLVYKSIADTAKEYSKYEAFHFAYNADFRGRIYCATSGLSPQGEDIAKGLLHFGEEVTHGRAGLYWLAVHGANTYGNDKIELSERVDWVYSLESAFREVVANLPESAADTREFWGAADKPWQFLAFILAWAETDFGKNPDAPGRLPIGLDGSCNGIQHYSAILRDKVGGAAVNLIDSKLPSDIYGDVANVLYTTLRRVKDIGLGDSATYAQIWLDAAFDRKLTKRPVMTLPYGSTRQSCKEYIHEWMLEHRDKFPVEDKDLFSLSLFLTPLLWESIGEVVVAARAGMAWLQAASMQIMNHSPEPLWWISPAGFPVYQDYLEQTVVRVRTMLAGGVNAIRVNTSVPTDKINRRKQRTGVAPNFIHSVDASHMVKTINATDFPAYAMIHDDFGTHAGNTEELWTAIREQFVEMYQTHAPLQEWLDAQNPDYIEDIAPLPPMGDLDITNVLESTYFFG